MPRPCQRTGTGEETLLESYNPSSSCSYIIVLSIHINFYLVYISIRF